MVEVPTGFEISIILSELLEKAATYAYFPETATENTPLSAVEETTAPTIVGLTKAD